MAPERGSIFRNLIATALLAALVFWLGRESADHGVFKFKRTEPVDGVALTAAPEASPTPTPLPVHFPDVSTADLPDRKDGYLLLLDAFTTCWPQARITTPPPDGEITPREAEGLFGKIKKRELLEKSGKTLRLGLLFDQSIFPAGAAGSATESDGRWTELHLRAAGRMLHCENPNRCECI